MRFFTPGLHMRYNSDDDAVADRADAEWERAIRAYQEHLQTLSDHMNERVKSVAQALCLHDAEILDFKAALPLHPFLQPPFSPGAATISLRNDGKIINLFYLLWEEVGEAAAPKAWPFSQQRVHWLYDEIDRVEPSSPVLFWHRILLSDGRVVSIPFTDLIVNAFPEENPQPVIATRRRA